MSSKCAKRWGKYEEKGCWCGGRVTRISSFVVKLSSSGALTDALSVPHNQGQAQSRPWPSPRLGTRSPRLPEGRSKSGSLANSTKACSPEPAWSPCLLLSHLIISKQEKQRETDGGGGGGEGREHGFGRPQSAGLSQVPRVRAQRRDQVEG